MRYVLSYWGVAFVIVLCAAAVADEAAPPPGLMLGPGGVVLKDGQPYRGIGVNYFDAFSRTLPDAANTSYEQGLDVLAQHDIPFIRFMACGFWPKDWDLYRQDKAEYFRRMDAFVKAAEDRGIGLIPSLFWYLATVPDLVGEPCNQWGNPESKTLAFMRAYIGEVVPRYVHSRALWAWELGNEYNLAADLPNAVDHRPAIVPHWGSPATRSEADDLTHDVIVTAFTEFAKEIRKYDPARLITTGNSLPRPAAHHMRIERSWTQDTPDEFAANLLAVTPDPMNLISIHVYPGAHACFDRKDVSYAEILQLCMAAAAKAGKALFVGEFGASDAEKDGGVDAARKERADILAAIETTNVPLAAYWAFDITQQDDTTNVTATNPRAYLLDDLQAANHRLRNPAAK